MKKDSKILSLLQGPLILANCLLGPKDAGCLEWGRISFINLLPSMY